MSKTEVTKESWSKFKTREDSSTYLQYYDKTTAYKIYDILGIANTKILDVACGNAQLYPVFKSQCSDLKYTGVDFSLPLLNCARELVCEDPNAKIIQQDMYEYLSECTEKFDIGVCSHIIECCESPDMVLGEMSRICKWIAIRFYNPPTYIIKGGELINGLYIKVSHRNFWSN